MGGGGAAREGAPITLALDRVTVSERIALTGPMPLSDYMAECLLHPEHGYYIDAESGAEQDVFGARGDFTTSPEVSQVMGELIGVWLFHGRRSAHLDARRVVQVRNEFPLKKAVSQQKLCFLQ